ncbi:MAG: hypothetical protein AABM67_10575 [Acidobacteriota bacterium]
MATEHSIPEEKPNRTLIIVVAAISAVVIVVFFYLLLRGTIGDNKPIRLEGAIRAGSPEFDKYKPLVALDDPVADEAKRPLGDMVMTLQTTARNFTGKTIIGLEVRAAVVDHQEQVVKEKTVVIIPGRRDELEPNKTMQVSIVLEGFTETDDRANIRMEVVGIKLQ